MTRVAIYARTSRRESEAEGSIPVQIADCKERAESKAWDIVNAYTDSGISGCTPMSVTKWTRRPSRIGIPSMACRAEASPRVC
jgi:hypothetical protein